jgi:hypothetical protein
MIFPRRNLHSEYFNSQKRCFKKLSGHSEGYKYHNPYFDGFMSNKALIYYELYLKVNKVASLLQEVKSYIIQYNNVIIGSNN